MTILSSFSFLESNIYADILLTNYLGLSAPPLVNLVTNLGLVAGALMGIFLILYYLCEAFSSFISKSRLWSTD